MFIEAIYYPHVFINHGPDATSEIGRLTQHHVNDFFTRPTKGATVERDEFTGKYKVLFNNGSIDIDCPGGSCPLK